MPANLPYPMQFDESQLKNKYSNYPDTKLPWYMQLLDQNSGGLYGGTAPTDAFGKPIQSYTDANTAAQADYQQRLAAYNAQQAQAPAAQGTQINNTGLADLQAQVNQGTINSANASLDNSIAAGTAPGYSGRGAETGIGNYPGVTDALIGRAAYQNQANKDYAAGVPIGMPQATAPASTGLAMPTPPDMTKAYLAALQNPGHVTSPGANVPEAAAPSTQSNVLQAFLQNWNGGKGAGNYDNSSVAAALRGNV